MVAAETRCRGETALAAKAPATAASAAIVNSLKADASRRGSLVTRSPERLAPWRCTSCPRIRRSIVGLVLGVPALAAQERQAASAF